MRYYKRNTTNLISMILSIFTLFGIMIVVPGVLGNTLGTYSAILGTFFILLPMMNALLQNYAASKVYDPQKYFFTLAFNESIFYEGVVCVSAIVLLFFLPATDLRVLGWPTTIGVVALWLGIAVLTTLLSRKLTRIEFLTDTILVRGINFFKSSGLSQKTTTGLGVYRYDEFEGFSLKEEKLVLLLHDGRGQVAVMLPEEKRVQITQYLIAKGVGRMEGK